MEGRGEGLPVVSAPSDGSRQQRFLLLASSHPQVVRFGRGSIFDLNKGFDTWEAPGHSVLVGSSTQKCYTVWKWICGKFLSLEASGANSSNIINPAVVLVVGRVAPGDHSETGRYARMCGKLGCAAESRGFSAHVEISVTPLDQCSSPEDGTVGGPGLRSVPGRGLGPCPLRCSRSPFGELFCPRRLGVPPVFCNMLSVLVPCLGRSLGTHSSTQIEVLRSILKL